TDSGVRLRHGDKRIGELRTAPFLLGRGEVSWEGAGAGGFLAICRADADVAEGSDVVSSGGCLERGFRRQSTALEREAFLEAELLEFQGTPV
ncbi:unnamed protein product, partial [Polarella glacialis]